MGDEYSDQRLKHAPFGDTFGTKADYTQGTFYGGNRRFLTETDNPLMPPYEFLTRKQSLSRIRLMKSEGLGNIQGMFQTENTFKTNRKHMLKSRKAPNKVIQLQTYSSIDPKDWVEEFQAGCKMWVNPTSGEVSAVCPWDPEGAESEPVDEEDSFEGTGAPVYESNLDDFFNELSRQPPSPTKTK
jgi:hypothetical protein